VARTLSGVAARILESGPYDEAQRLAEESLELRRTLGDDWGVANSLNMLSVNALEQGKLEKAKRLVKESIAIRQRIGHWGHEFWVSNWTLARTLKYAGKFREMQVHFQESQSLCEDLGLRHLIPWSNVGLSDANLHLGLYEAARALAWTALNDSREAGDSLLELWSVYWLGLASLALEAFDEGQQLLRESVGSFRKTDRQDTLGRALASLGLAAYGSGDVTRARALLCEAMDAGAGIKNVWTVVEALPAIALILADQGEAERAVELYALASRYPYVGNSRFFDDIAGKHFATVGTTLPAEVVAAAQERGRARDLWATAQEVLEKLGE
jgi:tetratricopeptide (TPR) repeat protein